EITFDTNLQQLIQTHKKQVTRFKYPITQLETIKFSLMKWLQHRKISSLPIYYYVSIADSSSILKIEGNDTFIREKVTFAENIPHYILQKNTQLSKQYKPNQQLKLNTIRTIMNEHQDLNIDIMKTFNIQPDDIRP